jgi:anti-repressor protein
MSMDAEQDIFDVEIEKRVQLLLRQEIERFANNPDRVIEAYQQKLRQKEAEIEALIPKADFADAVMQSDDWSEMTSVAKLLARKGWGRNNTFALLRERSILRYNNEPYQQYVERGYFKVVEQHFQNPQTGETLISKKTVVSQRGIDFVRRLIDEVN